jgi:uncharacterized protein
MIDAHVHLFPDRVFQAIWRWFDANAWSIRYRLNADEIVDFLVGNGVEKVVGLCYSHKPGMAESLNEFMADVARRRPEVIPCGTVLPGEPGARGIVARALSAGMRGIKIHCHVQCLAPDDERMDAVYEECAAAGRPVVIHGGNAPATTGYACDPRQVGGMAAMRRALERHPNAPVVLPHLGADEIDLAEALLDDFPHLHLDTTMMFGRFFPVGPDPAILRRRADRILYGTDFPNIPFEWDRERNEIARHLDGEALASVMGANAARVFG